MTVQLKKPRTIAPPTRRVRALAPKLADGTAVLGEGTTAPARPAAIPVASLLDRHVLRDGEVILLILKPSRWYVVLSSLLFAAGISLILCALQLSNAPHLPMHFYFDAGLFVVACRVMWGVLNWRGRLYVLTDQRILRVSGVFHIEVQDCPLRKVASTRIIRLFSERLLRLGSIEVLPTDETRPGFAWQTISRPISVQQQIETAIRNAKQGGCQ